MKFCRFLLEKALFISFLTLLNSPIYTADLFNKLIEKSDNQPAVALPSPTEQKDQTAFTPDPEVMKAFQFLHEKVYVLVLETDQLLAYLSLKINNTSIEIFKKDPHLKEKILTSVKGLRKTLTSIIREISLLSPDLTRINNVSYTSVEICREIIQWVNTLVKNKFTDFTPLSLEAIFKKKLPEELSLDTISQQNEKLKRSVKTLQNSIDNVDLTKYNKWARTVDSYIVQPIHRYHLLDVAKFGALTGVVGLVAAWEFGSFYTGFKWDAYLKEHSIQIQDAIFRIEKDLKLFSYNLEDSTTVKLGDTQSLWKQFGCKDLQELKNKKESLTKELEKTVPEQLMKKHNGNLKEALQEFTGNVLYVKPAEFDEIRLFSEQSVPAKNDIKDKKQRAERAVAKQTLNNLAGTIYQKRLMKSFESNNNRFLAWLYKSFGWPYKKRMGGIDWEQNSKSPDKYGRISAVEGFLTECLSRHLPLVTGLGGYLFSKYQGWWQGGEKEQQAPGLKEKISTVIQQKWNQMRGGAYLKTKPEGLFDFEPTVTFEDIVGLDEAKEILSHLVAFISNPEMYANVKISPEIGYLLTGPTRTGKTFIFEALCGEIMKELRRLGRDVNEYKFKIIPAEMIIQYGVRGLLEWAKAQAPIVLFIDEIDLLNVHREGILKLLAEFLQSLGNSSTRDPKRPVIIIGATNRPEKLDPALRAAGRLGKEIRFDRPSFAHRYQYLVREFNNMALDVSDFNLEVLVQKTAGASFEDLHTILMSALRFSWMHQTLLNQELIEHMINVELRHILTVDDKKLLPTEKAILSAHFAGKAVAATLLDLINPLDMVTIQPIMLDHEHTAVKNVRISSIVKQQKIKHGGIFTKEISDTINFKTRDQQINEIKLLLAGFAAEEIMLGGCSYSCHAHDRDRALTEAQKLIFGGLERDKLSKQQERALLQESYELMTQCKNEVKTLLQEHEKALKEVAGAFGELPTLNDRMIQFIMGVAEGKIDLDKIKAQMEAESKKMHPEGLKVETPTVSSDTATAS